MFPLGGPSDGYHFVYLHGGATWYQNAPYSEYAYRAIDANRHVGEIALTLFDAAAQEGLEVSLPHELYVDDIIGLSCLYDDHDEEGLVHDGQWKTHESGDGVVDATVIAHFVLVPDPAGVAAVEAETWARLKSGLAGRINSR